MVSSFSARTVSRLYAKIFILLFSNSSLKEYSTACGVILSPDVISTFMTCLVLSRIASIDTRIPGYSDSSRIFSNPFRIIFTPSSTGQANISFIASASAASESGIPLIVASISIVDRVSIPTIAAISMPPFNMNLSRKEDRDILSNSLSSIKFLNIISACTLFSFAIFRISAFS